MKIPRVYLSALESMLDTQPVRKRKKIHSHTEQDKAHLKAKRKKWKTSKASKKKNR